MAEKRIKKKDIEKELEDMDINSALERIVKIQNEHGISLEKLYDRYLKKKAAYEKECARYEKMCCFEKDAYKKGVRFVAGVDEAGRGPLAGPVVAAAVILPENVFIEGLNDSKQLTAKKRDELFDIIKEKALSYGIGIVDEKCIDEINILNAARKAMAIAVKELKPQPDLVLVDAERLVDVNINQISIIRGDTLSVSIAAASIIAKVTRDRMICSLDQVYPEYGFAKHKGYGTKEHIDAIKKYGICPIHRISFTKNFI
jgi:ribonuclease HII